MRLRVDEDILKDMQDFVSGKDDFAKRYKAGGDQKEKSVSTGWMCVCFREEK